MDEVNRSFLIEKLKLFLGDAGAEEVIDRAAVAAGFDKKDNYSQKEMGEIIAAMITQGGIPEFVARNAKVSQIFNK